MPPFLHAGYDPLWAAVLPWDWDVPEPVYGELLLTRDHGLWPDLLSRDQHMCRPKQLLQPRHACVQGHLHPEQLPPERDALRGQLLPQRNRLLRLQQQHVLPPR